MSLGGREMHCMAGDPLVQCNEWPAQADGNPI
jgi:hypothetical protein